MILPHSPPNQNNFQDINASTFSFNIIHFKQLIYDLLEEIKHQYFPMYQEKKKHQSLSHIPILTPTKHNPYLDSSLSIILPNNPPQLNN